MVMSNELLLQQRTEIHDMSRASTDIDKINQFF
jgi:hypothetical protein